MTKQKRYWLIGLIIAAIVILLLIFGMNASSPGTNTPAPDAGHGHGTDGITGNASTESNETPPDSVKGDPLTLYLAEQDTIMNEMMENMTVAPSGNAAIDFLKGMIPHHESAIDMSESYLNYGGSNPDLKKLADEIIRAQSDEIDQMNRLIEEIENTGIVDEEKEQGYLDSYHQMMSGHQHMGHGTSAASDVESAFAEGMLMHHQMAVDMAKAILDYTDHEEVRRLAQTIIDAQELEIAQMQDILNQQK